MIGHDDKTIAPYIGIRSLVRKLTHKSDLIMIL